MVIPLLKLQCVEVVTVLAVLQIAIIQQCYKLGQMGIMLHLHCECYNAFGVFFVKNLATVI